MQILNDTIMCCKDIKGFVLWCIYRFHHWFVSSCKEVSYLDSGAINLNWLLITQSNMNKKHVTFDWLKKHSFFFGLRFAFIYTTFGWGKKDGWIGKRNPSRSEELGEEKASVSLSLFNLTFPCPLYFQSLQSLVPIFLPTRKLKEKIAFHYFFPSGF